MFQEHFYKLYGLVPYLKTRRKPVKTYVLKFGSLPWSALSYKLNLPDFYPWGHLKKFVYAAEKPTCLCGFRKKFKILSSGERVGQGNDPYLGTFVYKVFFLFKNKESASKEKKNTFWNTLFTQRVDLLK